MNSILPSTRPIIEGYRVISDQFKRWEQLPVFITSREYRKVRNMAMKEPLPDAFFKQRRFTKQERRHWLKEQYEPIIDEEYNAVREFVINSDLLLFLVTEEELETAR
jgi:hypothetical protein